MKRNDLILLFTLIVFGILTRTIFHFGANIEFVTALGIAAGYFFTSKKFALLVPGLIMLISDLIIGNSVILIFTWSAFLVTPIIGNLLKSIVSRYNLNNSHLTKLIYVQASGIVFTVLFYLWTNFGVVIVNSYYPHTLSGLMQSYINALPFLRPQLYTNLFIVPAVFVATNILMSTLNYTKQNLETISNNN